MEEQGRWEKVEERRWSGESRVTKVAWMGHGEGVGGEGGWGRRWRRKIRRSGLC